MTEPRMETMTLGGNGHRRARRTRLVLAMAVTLLAGVLAVAPGPFADAEQHEGSTAATRDAQRRMGLGAEHSCAVLDNGKVQCWGANSAGQLGNGSITTTNAPQYATGLIAALEVAGGNAHTCALIAGGTVSCWGLNGSGQLGDNSTTDRHVPVQVAGIDDATAIAVGGFHSCALRSSGTVSCWGHDGAGQLGDGANAGPTAGTALAPVNVSGLTDATAITAGEFHMCARRATGGVSCWGHNGFGQLGNNTETSSETPVAVSGIPDGDDDEAIAITAGASHSCAVLEDGKARCWGGNDRGQLGDGTFDNRKTPVTAQFDADPSILGTDEQDLGGVTTVSAGAKHTCARLVSGAARCWGDAGLGQLGDGTTGDKDNKNTRRLAVAVLGPAVNAITTGGYHTCAITGTTMSCWGYNFHGQLGSSLPQRNDPVTVTALRGAARVAVGTRHACALTDISAVPPSPPYEVTCWGTNANGELGAGFAPADVPKTMMPVPVPGVPAASAITAGNGSICTEPHPENGTAKCWGRNGQGQLGDGSTTMRTSPVSVAGLATGLTQISGGGAFATIERGLTCARLSDGTAQCWGDGDSGQLGNAANADSAAPVTVKYDHDNDVNTAPVPLTGVVEVGAGGRHACAVLTDSKVRCWGENGNAQLGNDSLVDRNIAVHVLTADDGDPDTPRVPFSGAVHINGGESHTCVTKTDLKVNCWGRNNVGQLGDNSTTQRRTPVETRNIPQPPTPKTGATQITVGDNHSCALLENTSVRCWGLGTSGQLGDGDTDNERVPVAPTDLGNPDDDILDNVPAFIYDVSAGRVNTCVVFVDTTVRCWGDNSQGQLGDGVGISRLSPIPVQSLGAGINGNSIPSPDDDAFVSTVDVPVSFSPSLLDGDTDADGHALTAALFEQADHGTAAVNADGTGSYTPGAGFCGVDSFRYSATDGIAVVPAIVTITIPCPNTPPTATTDTGNLLEDGSVTVDVLANDSDVDADPLSVAAVGAPANGTATIVDGGKVKYTPAADWCTTDSFTYDLSDGPGGHLTTGTVDVTITCINDHPVANADAASTAEDTAGTFDLVANDVDPDGPTLGIMAFSQPAHGSVAADTQATVVYTPTPDYCGADSFGYTVSDGTASHSSTVSVNVTCTGDAPTPLADVTNGIEDTPVTVAVLGNDSDPDGDTLSVAGVTQPLHGTSTHDGTSVTYTPATDYCGSDSFTYTASDGGLTADAGVTITIGCGNDAPLANDDTPTTDEDTPLGISPLANDVDPDGDTLTLGVVTDPGNGSVSVQPGNAVLYTPDADFCGTDAFTYTVGDGHGSSDTGVVSVSVTCVNDAPSLAPIADRSGPWGSAITAIAFASDVDAGDSISYSLVAPPAGASIDSSSGAFTWTPTSAQIGTHTVTVSASDGTASDDVSFTVTVTPQPPSLVYTGATTGEYSDNVAVSAVLKDGAATGIAGRTVTFTIGAASVAAVTDGSGVAAATLVLNGVAGPSTVKTTFGGDSLFAAVADSDAFTVKKETVGIAFSSAPLVLTSGTSAAVALTAALTESADGSLGSALGTVQVSFRELGGAVLCSATAVPGSTPGTATGSCTAPALAVGSRALIVSIAGPHYRGPVDVAVVTVARAVTGSASGAGRAGPGDAFGFQATPGARRAPPTGDAIHVYRSGGFAYVVRSSTVGSLAVTCTKGSPKTCTGVVQATGATTTPISLADGVVSPPVGSSSIRIDATDVAEPVAGSVPADRYAVGVTGSTTYSLGSPAAQVPITAGNIRAL